MTAAEILDEYDKWAPTRAYSYNSDHEAFARFVIDVVLPREFLKAYHADRDCGCVQQ